MFEPFQATSEQLAGATAHGITFGRVLGAALAGVVTALTWVVQAFTWLGTTIGECIGWITVNWSGITEVLKQPFATAFRWIDALEHVVPITADQKRAAFDMLTQMAVDRQKAINADHPVVQEFWELFDHLNDTDQGEKLNHSRDDELIAVSLPEFQSRATQFGLKVPSHSDLKRLLPESRARKFMAYRTVNSAIRIVEGRGVSVKCWVFRRDRAPSTMHD
jgi:hypothetical protein